MQATLILILILILGQSLYAQDLDQEILAVAKRFRMTPLKNLQDQNPALTKLGHRLFHDVKLSRHDNIACIHCHHPRLGTSDNLPLSIGVGATGLGQNRIQTNDVHITKRHANHVINKGHPEFSQMFWDGRVEIYSDGSLQTPEPALNGSHPARPDIKNQLDTAIAAQALFPISNDDEMFGPNPEGFNNLDKWEIIAKKISADTSYLNEFRSVFNSNEDYYNIGYIAKALGHFQSMHFQVTNTRWDKYLAGDLTALTLTEKRGAKLFLSKARCFMCHNGPHLGGNAFANSASPQLIFSKTKNDDLGRYEVTQNEKHKYMFRIAPLRGLAYTAPYFHSGVFSTLEEVVDHYNDPYTSLRNFQSQISLNNYSQNYVENFGEMSTDQIEERLKRLPMFYRHHGPLGLSDSEKKDLVEFLRKSLAR